MTIALEHLTNEVRKLTLWELDQLRAWVMDYQPMGSTKTGHGQADWSDHAARVREIFGDSTLVRENPVLALREEERV